jgi:hypothetical protein
VNLLRHRLVDVEARRHEHQIRPLLTCRHRRHGGIGARLARLKAGGRHHAALSTASSGIAEGADSPFADVMLNARTQLLQLVEKPASCTHHGLPGLASGNVCPMAAYLRGHPCYAAGCTYRTGILTIPVWMVVSTDMPTRSNLASG